MEKRLKTTKTSFFIFKAVYFNLKNPNLVTSYFSQPEQEILDNAKKRAFSEIRLSSETVKGAERVPSQPASRKPCRSI